MHVDLVYQWNLVWLTCGLFWHLRNQFFVSFLFLITCVCSPKLTPFHIVVSHTLLHQYYTRLFCVLYDWLLSVVFCVEFDTPLNDIVPSSLCFFSSTKGNLLLMSSVSPFQNRRGCTNGQNFVYTKNFVRKSLGLYWLAQCRKYSILQQQLLWHNDMIAHCVVCWDLIAGWWNKW